MTIDFVPDQNIEYKPRITVFGVGGGGGNAVNNMISGQLDGVEFVVANTDSQSLHQSLCDQRIQLGVNITHGLGAGARPDIGKVAAEEALDEIQRYFEGNNMVFIAAGMGGGTGTGAAPVIARAAREKGILTVGVVTKPFQFEGVQRMRSAELGIQELQQYVDTLIVIPNQNLFRVANEQTTFASAFKMADDVLHAGVRGVTDLMVNPGLINLDFADIRTVMSEMGKAMMGTGEADGENRATAAAEAAINNPLLDNASIEGAHGVLINITGGPDLTLHEIDEAAMRICKEVDTNANIIFGTSLDAALEDRMRVAVIATGIDADEARAPLPEHSDKVHVLGFSERKVTPNTPAATSATAMPEQPAEAPKIDDWSDEQPDMPATEARAESAPAAPEPAPQPPREAAHVADPALSDLNEPGEAPTTAPEPRSAAVAVEPSPPTGEPATKTVAANTAGAVAAGIAGASTARALGKPDMGLPAKLGAPAMPHRQPAPATPAPRATAPAYGAPPQAGGDPKETGAKEEPRAGRRLTLFERMTGTGRARRQEDEARPAPRTEGAPDHVAASRVAGVAPRARSEDAGFDPLRASSAAGPADDDPLEIPAFLRRQAN